MGKSDVVDMLFELLGDPIRLEAIRDDPIIKDVLNKILVMQKLTAKGIFFYVKLRCIFCRFLFQLKFHDFFVFVLKRYKQEAKTREITKVSSPIFGG